MGFDLNDADAELAELLRAATAPLPDFPAPKFVPAPLYVRRFLKEHGVAPGQAASIEVCSLYRMYREWSMRLDEQPRLVRPMRFSQILKQLGFKRDRPSLRKTDRDRKCLLVRKEIAIKLIEWLKEHPDSDLDRQLMDPRHRWNRREVAAP